MIGALKLCLVSVVVVALAACGHCPDPKTVPSSHATARAVVDAADKGLAAAQTVCGTLGSAKCAGAHAEAFGHLQRSAAANYASFWCTAQNLLDGLEKVAAEITAGGGIVPAELVDALELARWAVSRVACECATAAG